jgi:transcription termination/antitermination protein NusG
MYRTPTKKFQVVKTVLSDDGEAMSMFVNSNSTLVCPGAIPGSADLLQEWFAVYTSPRHEKKVTEHLALRNVEAFLPLYSSVRRWKNGCKVTVDLPLFPGYLFVRVNRHEKVRVLETPGVLWFVGVGGQPATLAESEVEALRAGVRALNCEPHPYLVVGEKARIRKGPLEGFEGVLTRKKGALRVVISLTQIMKSIAIEVDANDVEPIGKRISCPLTA